jgi:Ca2+-binding RTX toxin-like protein
MPITATYTPGTFTLSVLGTSLAETMTIERDAAGMLLVNAGAIPISGGPATVANTDLVSVAGGDGDDTITLNEANGALPKAELSGGNGNDTLTGGSGDDTLTGEADNDTLFGRGGIDQLFGGTGNDILAGGDGNDSMFGEDGDDRMIWNPGDDSDLMEGGNGTDTAEVNGGNGAEFFTITANGTRVRFDRTSPAPFTLDIGTTENLVLNANGGDDNISASGNLAGLISLTIDGGAGNDTILGGNGADTLFGGDDNDFIDGNQGNDTAFLGNGDDTFNWDPGDGSDIVEGQAGIDTLNFNASNAIELMDVSANGSRVRATRNVGNIVMDMNGVEVLTVNLLGGADGFTVNDLTGTDLTQVNLNLATTIGGSVGDGAADSITVNGSDAVNVVSIIGAGTSVSVNGLAAAVNITTAEGANDRLTVNGQGDNDTITATALAAGIIQLTIDGGAGNDMLFGSQGADTFIGGDGNDYVLGDNGNDVAFLGNGDDIFEWSPGDGSDVIEGQANTDELRFNGSNASENYNISANGARILFTRDVAAITMDMDDVERIRINTLGGADNITIGDLTGTDANLIVLQLAASAGGGDGASDNVFVNGTANADTITVSAAAGLVIASGLPAAVALSDAEGANDRLTINGNGGDDVINASGLAAGFIQLTLNGGQGNDLLIGSAGNDLVVGGIGNDTALLGAGDDTFTWNPGDGSDIVEGQAGIDTLQFNGANIAETITVSANGGRTLFTRDVASIVMDLNDVEVIRFTALGGADNITVNDLTGTDVSQLVFDLASTSGGASGDGVADIVTLNGSGSANLISFSGNAAALVVSGLPWTVTLNQIETTDRLTILAGEGDDTISTTGLANQLAILTLDGGGGNDVIRSTGDGTYLGGTGDDLIFAGLTNSSEVLDGGDGIDTLDTTSFGSAYIINLATGATSFAGESFVNFENLTSGAGADTVTGTSGANIIRTNAGIDNVNAGDGNDIVEGGAGGDTLDGGLGVDTVDYSSSTANVTINLATNSASGGHATGDIISNFENVTGSAFADTLTGNGGANVLNGGGNADLMTGAGGDDVYFVDNSLDSVRETAGGGNDRVLTSVSYALESGQSVELFTTTDYFATTALNLTGNELVNVIFGNDGANTLDGKAGADTLVGRAGDDFYFVDSAGDVVLENAGEGSDRVFASVSWVLAAGASVEMITTDFSPGTTAINLTGNALVQQIVGNNGANILDGGGGADLLFGRLGDDFYLVDNAGDQVFENAGEGNDRVFASVSYALAAGASVELLTTDFNPGTAAINLTGNELANTIVGNDGANILDGASGVDTMVGRLGDDFYFVDNAGDVVLENAGEGNDRVLAGTSYVLGAGVSVEFLSTSLNVGTSAINLTGNELANTILGNDGANSLDGGTGADAMFGRAGDDFYFVDNVGDGVFENAGEGNDRVFAATSWTLSAGASVELVTTDLATGTNAINLTGNELANTIVGNDGVNLLDGKGGSDILVGRTGADTFAFTTAIGAGNVDRLLDFQGGVDKIALDDAVFTAIGPTGALNANAFVTGSAAADASDRIIYNNATGQLFYDADGTGAIAAVLIATLDGNPAIGAGDFMVI